ncbi:MAG TPA: ROK family protein [Kiritimatiellia bacterium]|nr:ROK family protein [Kiritimatiellia bacterium]HMP33498.1 ROK family protein [Kiritimatiellia bacterium]
MSMSNPTDLYLAIDLGGTKTAVCVGDATGRLVHGERMPTEASAPPSLWRDRLAGLIDAVLVKAGVPLRDIVSVGLAVPGPMNVAAGLVLTPPNMPAWRNVPVRAWVETLTGKPVHINNDANAAGLAEYRFGAFRGTPDLIYLTMSTGIGGGVISGGRLVQGARDLGGEIGHMVLDPQGLPCPCGQRGCLEMYCGGRNVILQVQAELAAGSTSSVLDESNGDPKGLTLSAIARAAARQDALALRYWDTFLERLAQGIGTLCMCFNPSAIVLGTAAIHTGDLLLNPLRERLARYAWPDALKDLKIAPSALGPQIGELGALALALEAGSNR